MKTSNYTVRIIEPNDGYSLTQAANVDVTERIFSKKIFLAVNDSPTNWVEITDAEVEAIKAEQERIAQEMIEKEPETVNFSN